MTPEERDIEIADYLAGDLSPAARERFEERLAADEELRSEVEALCGVADRLVAAAEVAAEEPVEPPPLTLPVGEIPAGRRAEAHSRRWPSLRPAAMAIAAAVAVAAVVVVVVVSSGDSPEGPDSQASTVALEPFDTGPTTASGTLQSGTGDGAAVLSVSGLAPSSRRDYYEAWLISGDEKQLLPLGSFSVGADGRAEVDIELPLDSADVWFVDISLEPDDGDPSHSGDSVLRGQVEPS